MLAFLLFISAMGIAYAQRRMREAQSTVLKEFIQHNTIIEKYDVVRRESELAGDLRFGYQSNETGFGWTNAAFTEMFVTMTPARRIDVLRERGVLVPR